MRQRAATRGLPACKGGDAAKDLRARTCFHCVRLVADLSCETASMRSRGSKEGYMKWTAALLFFALPATVSAQRTNRPIDPANNNAAFTPIDMYTPPSLSARPAPPGKTVSMNELLVPPKALKELQRSVKAYNARDFRGSNEHLEKALRIYPDLWQAHFDLGGNYIRLGEYERSLPEFQKALELNDSFPQAHHGRSVALFFLHRYPESEASARRARELDPDSVEYRYMLARSIVAQGRFTAEAKELLQQSAARFPNANLVLAELFLNQGKIDEVVAELRTYLQSPDKVNRSEAECWLALLNGTATGECAAQKGFPQFH
jgi:tetratricopeptide (TPR) repeat protein